MPLPSRRRRGIFVVWNQPARPVTGIDERLLALHDDAVLQHPPVVLGEQARRSPRGKKSNTVLPRTSASPAAPSSRRLRRLLRT